MSPTRRLVWSATAVAAASFVLMPWLEFAPSLLAAALGAVLAGGDAWTLMRGPKPTVELSAPEIVNLRRPFTVTVELNRPLEAWVAAPSALGATQPVHGGGAVLFPRQRGSWSIGDVWCFESSRLGLWKRRTIVTTERQVDVWPDLVEEDAGLGLLQGQEGTAVRRGAQRSSLELRGLRPFVSGDDPRHVDWKATARHAYPVVREWEPERRRSVIFALDAGRLMRSHHYGETKFDACLRALARVAFAAGANGDRVGALVFDSRTRRFLPPFSGRGQAFQLLRALNDVQPALVASDFRAAVPFLLSHQRRALVIVMTDLVDPEAALGLAEASKELVHVHVPFAVLVRDPVATEQRRRVIRTEHDAYDRAASELVLEDRRAALGQLRARGLDAIDAPMENLGVAAVELYLQARATAAW